RPTSCRARRAPVSAARASRASNSVSDMRNCSFACGGVIAVLPESLVLARGFAGGRSGCDTGLAQHGDEAAAALHVGGGADVVDHAGTGIDQAPGGGDGCGFGIEAHDDQRRLHLLQARGNDRLAALGGQDAGVALELWHPLAIGAAIAIIDLLALVEADAVAQGAGGDPGRQSGRLREGGIGAWTVRSMAASLLVSAPWSRRWTMSRRAGRMGSGPSAAAP